MSDTTGRDLGDWEGAIGPQSENEPMFYEMTQSDDRIRLVGAAPGMQYEYSRDEFETLIEDGEWIPADNDRENEVFQTPNGEMPY